MLAQTGLDSFWMVVSGVAFVMAGVVLTRLRPKKEF
jgi:LPXTG-motif cell wall-anchored protein